MKIRPLIIDDAVRAKIMALREYSSNNSISAQRLAELSRHDINAGASRFDFASHTLDLPFGYRVTFTVEQQPIGFCRHLSVSVSTPRKLPAIAVVEMLMSEFGFINRLGKVPLWTETFDPGHQAINIIEPLTGKLDELRRKNATKH
jgi:hypothetical protein